MKKLYVIALAALVAISGLTAVAVAQYGPPSATLEGSLTPTASGTKKKPKRSTIRFKATNSPQSRTTADRIEIFTPRDVRLNGRGWKFYCSYTEINQEGVGDCPKQSEITTGATNVATAAVGPRLTPITFKVRLFWGSPDEWAVYLEATALRIQKAIPALITRAGSPYFNKITIVIPPELQKQLGAFVYLTGIDARVGRTITVNRKKRHAVTSVGCPRDRKHRYETRFHFVANDAHPNGPTPNEVKATDTSPCRKGR